MAEADVVNVDKDFVFSLPVPDLAAGVARIGDDGPYCALGPCDPGSVAVAARVVGRRAGNAIGAQAFGDGVKTTAFQELTKDPGHDGSGELVEFQSVLPLAFGRLGGIGMGTGISQAIAVRRPAPKEAAFHLSLGLHGAAHADLDAIALALAHPGEHAHDEVMGLVVRVDRAAHLGHPERNPEVLEDGKGQAVLVAVEGPLRLTDHHRVEAAVGVA
nr:hypothetical protein [Streptosporangium lutulentum]